jgi:hypothetical protein
MKYGERVTIRQRKGKCVGERTLRGAAKVRVFFLLAGGTLPIPADCRLRNGGGRSEETMHGLIYLVGLIVVILAILSFFGLR